MSLSLAGCEVAPPPEQAAVQAEALPPGTKVPARWSSPADSAAVATGWVASFRDRTLSALVAEALANNPDLKISASRVDEARQALIIAGSPLFPAISADASGDTTRNGDEDQTYDRTGGNLSALWEVDVWGKVRSGQSGAFARLEAVEQNNAFARLSIAALVARSWFTILGLQQNAAIARQQVDNYSQQLVIVREKQAGGVVDMMDVDLSEGSVWEAKADLVELEARIDAAIRGLEVLLGRYPSRELNTNAGFPSVPARVPTGTPASLVNRRPDVVAAERQVVAAFFDVEVAELSLLPSFSLTGRGGRLNDAALGVLGLSPNYLQAGATILQPIFQGGALNADIASASARKRGAVAAYGAALLGAFQEVEVALANESYFRERLGYLQAESESWASSVVLGQDKFTEGTITMQNLLQLQERQEAAEQQVVEARTGILINRVDLYLALGGGL